MSRIRAVLVPDKHPAHPNVSLGTVNQWISNLRSIPYGFTREWKTPAETESGRAADCKAKAVALYEMMQSHGATHLRLIIGKYTAASRSTHAWVEWENEMGSYVLDPTLYWRAYQTRDFGGSSYIPFYAFEGSRKYVAAQTGFVVRN